MRRIYQYLSIEEKVEIVEKLKEEVKKLEEEIRINQDAFSSFIMEILYSTKDKWNLEIDELSLEIESKNIESKNIE
ncbi:hypothetical protein [Bacillus solimangrovi]|uniref:Uncharacterized protein n=1 Tax=Bacillus solimangrovi TaxID=1305675 RepID=A0A1E5LAK8_9BACI|nr:hypothetical protein [Bacillus solimangrovi]OEH91115.1 hypothetical protein BFG57_07015 [Bacillus solimangrovi]